MHLCKKLVRSSLIIAGCLLVTSTALDSLASTNRSNSKAPFTLATLTGTNWCATNAHSRVAVNMFGRLQVKEGKDVCLSFRQEEQVLIIRVVWWNIAAKIHVNEWAIAVPIGTDRLAYYEAQGHSYKGDDAFPGIAGEGYIWFNADNTLSMSQSGTLRDGSAAAFVTKLVRVEQLPPIPLEQTYPPR